MKFSWVIITLITSIFMFGCKNTLTKYVMSEKQKIVNEIRTKTALEIENQLHLIPCGIGGQMMNNIEMLALSFDYNESVDIETARALLVRATDIFVHAVNDDQRVHQYLANDPFNVENVEIRIFLRSKTGGEVEAGALSVASMLRGELKYKIDDPQTKMFTTLLRESYEEACRKIEQAEEPIAM